MPGQSLNLKNHRCCLCLAAVNGSPRVLPASKCPWFKPSLRTSLIKQVFITSHQCFRSGSFSYCRPDIRTRPPAAIRDGNEMPRPPSSTSTRCRESGKLLRFKGEELSYGLSPSLQERSSASVLSEFLIPFDLLPFPPYLVIPFCAATKLAAVPPACSH